MITRKSLKLIDLINQKINKIEEGGKRYLLTLLEDLKELKKEKEILLKELNLFDEEQILKLRDMRSDLQGTVTILDDEKIPPHQQFGYRNIQKKLKKLNSGEFEKSRNKIYKKEKEINEKTSDIEDCLKAINKKEETIKLLNNLKIKIEREGIERKNFLKIKISYNLNSIIN